MRATQGPGRGPKQWSWGAQGCCGGSWTVLRGLLLFYWCSAAPTGLNHPNRTTEEETMPTRGSSANKSHSMQRIRISTSKLILPYLHHLEGKWFDLAYQLYYFHILKFIFATTLWGHNNEKEACICSYEAVSNKNKPLFVIL
ncbi:hypothetical protein AMECASPLE_010883 [Ameca splendens]|uniref:Uncharacterized protein n=1 Tax=Ameca splendens TaxID=208324 RepID=A0ABV1A7E7_9TELE